MQQQRHILSLHTPATPGVDSKVKTFFLSLSSHVAYQLKRMEHRESYKHIFCPYTHTHTLNLWVGLKDEKNLKVVQLHIKLKGKKEV